MRRSWWRWRSIVLTVAMGVGALAVGLPAQAASGPSTQTGPTWKIQSTPNPDGSIRSILSSVSCSQSGKCMAVGTYYTSLSPPPGIQDTLAERWNGASWSIVTMPPITGVNNAILSGVSCAKSDACMAVGYTVTSPDKVVVRALCRVLERDVMENRANPTARGRNLGHPLRRLVRQVSGM